MSIVASWQDARIDTLELEADAIQAAVIQIDKLDGLFDPKSKFGLLLQECKNDLGVEESNRRKTVEKARKGGT